MISNETLLIEALKHIAMQLDDSYYNILGVEPPKIAERLPHIRQFALDMAEGGGKRPGFTKFVELRHADAANLETSVLNAT